MSKHCWHLTQHDNFRVFAGKFNPSFGTAWDLAPGVYGVDIAEDYELAERIGFGGSYTIDGGEAGSHTLTANAFFADTTFLSGSAIHDRGDLEEEDGGISNTEDLSSYSVTLDSESVAGIEGLNTHLGYRNQSEGDADVDLDRETGYVAGANYTFPLCENVDVTALAEWAGIRDSEGGDDDIDYFTTSLSFALYDNWNVALSHTARNTDVQGGDDVDDHISQISFGYAFDNGITFDVGYNHLEESDIETDTVGALVGYVFEF